MSARLPYIAEGLDHQGRVTPTRHTAYPATEPDQPAPAECCTHYGMEEEGEPLSLAETVRAWLLLCAPAVVALCSLALLLVWSRP